MPMSIRAFKGLFKAPEIDHNSCMRLRANKLSSLAGIVAFSTSARPLYCRWELADIDKGKCQDLMFWLRFMPWLVWKLTRGNYTVEQPFGNYIEFGSGQMDTKIYLCNFLIGTSLKLMTSNFDLWRLKVLPSLYHDEKNQAWHNWFLGPSVVYCSVFITSSFSCLSCIHEHLIHIEKHTKRDYMQSRNSFLRVADRLSDNGPYHRAHGFCNLITWDSIIV